MPRSKSSKGGGSRASRTRGKASRSRAVRPARSSSRAGARHGRKATARRSYGPRAADQVREEMHEMKRGRLRSGRSGRKVTNPKQAIAIGLSKARRSGAKVPPRGR